METTDDDEDLKLVQASANLMSDIESVLPKLLWRPSKTGTDHGRVHTRVRRHDLDYVIKLIEPFQGEPQLLDARLKHIVPPIVHAYLQYLQSDGRRSFEEHTTLEDAVCNVLYTLCKVRGFKVIVGFFNNEARYLELILGALERTVAAPTAGNSTWQVHYVLLLWLSHLLLTPFDLVSISDSQPAQATVKGLELTGDLPLIATRCLQVSLHYLLASTKAQDAAAAMLVRFVTRPDMQRLRLGDSLVKQALQSTENRDETAPTSIYERLGPMRFLAGIAASADLAHLVPRIYQACEKLANDTGSSVASNAVAKKLTVKILRNVAILCLRSASTQGPLLNFLESSNVLEDVIDYLLRSLGDRDTPVRYAAAKAVSLIAQELDPTMGHEVIQAVLDSFREDLPRHSRALHFRNADPLKWHGLTLTLAHVLFKRTASPEQLPDILNALVAALQFEQRTSTGSSLGTNVRDAANFGIWSFSRRYTTKELLAVRTEDILYASGETSAIQTVAIQLILSACFDPAGNIRRGSSAALQELIGRHPNQVYAGISLVQIVEYQAVGLRRRAMVEVSGKAAELHEMYWTALVDAVLGWRGVGSPDVTSREAAAASLAKLSGLHRQSTTDSVSSKVVDQVGRCSPGDVETLHGLVLAMSYIVEADGLHGSHEVWGVVGRLPDYLSTFSPWILRAQLPSAAVALVAALCRHQMRTDTEPEKLESVPFTSVEMLTERILARQEDTILQSIPPLVRSLLTLKRSTAGPLGCIGAQDLCKKVAADSTKSTLGGAGRAITLGALAPMYGDGLKGEKAATAISTLASMMAAMNVDWRVVGMRALHLAVEGSIGEQAEPEIVEKITDAVHRGLNDYTIDERGDVGSLVRLQAIACVSDVLGKIRTDDSSEATLIVKADIVRLSLEKLDRVRIRAAQCRERFMPFGTHVTDLASVSTHEYFYSALHPLRSRTQESRLIVAVLEGCASCAGVGAEGLLHASRAALVETLKGIEDRVLHAHLSAYTALLKGKLAEGSNMHPALELLAFLLNMQILHRLAETDFKWRNLLSTVQKSHHKSNDMPRILAAVHVYRGMAEVPVLRIEVMKKLISMLKSNPYPRVRASVAETLFVISKAEALKTRNWAKPAAQNMDVITGLQQEYIVS